MIKAVIFDMFETLVTLFSGPVYMGREIAAEIGLAETKFREIWDTTDGTRQPVKRKAEFSQAESPLDVIDEIGRIGG